MTKDNFEKGVPFDPGYGDFVIPFSDTIDAIKFELSKYKSKHQKKFQFTKLLLTIQKVMTNTCSFYLGCLLWAGYINNKFKDEPKEILENPFTDITEEKLEQLDFLYEVNYLLGYLDQYEKDCKFYMGKSEPLDTNYKKIAENYKEFLQLNNNFIKAKKTSDLKLPPELEHFKAMPQEKLDELYFKIFDSINNATLEELLEIGFYK